MGDDKKDRQFSLKELLGVMTWGAVTVATLRIGFVNESIYLYLIGASMLLIGVGCVVGFVLDGRPGSRACVVGALMFLLLLSIITVALAILSAIVAVLITP